MNGSANYFKKRRFKWPFSHQVGGQHRRVPDQVAQRAGGVGPAWSGAQIRDTSEQVVTELVSRIGVQDYAPRLLLGVGEQRNQRADCRLEGCKGHTIYDEPAKESTEGVMKCSDSWRIAGLVSSLCFTGVGRVVVEARVPDREAGELFRVRATQWLMAVPWGAARC